MRKIAKVYFSCQQSTSNWDGSNERVFMGEDSYMVGETLGKNKEITDIQEDSNRDVLIYVNGERAIKIRSHSVHRIFYGE
jgi:hypothetical protein